MPRMQGVRVSGVGELPGAVWVDMDSPPVVDIAAGQILMLRNVNTGAEVCIRVLASDAR